MKKYILLITILTFGLVGCDSYLDVNTNPNNPTTVGPDLILPVGLNYTARWIQTDRSVNHLGNMIMYNWSESAGFSWYNDEFQYRANSSTFYDQIFNNAYNRALKQYNELTALDETQYPAYVAIGMIMKAYTFQILVDFYGDIPYSEALQRSGATTPSYVDAQEVYDDLIVQLTSAIDLLSAAEDDPLSTDPDIDDIMYHGDLTGWKQFANTIKLRILTRESDVKDNTYLTQELTVIANEGSGYITSDVGINPLNPDDDTPVGYRDEAGKQNPFWEDFGTQVGSSTPTLTGDATCATDYIITLLTNTGDPRIDFLYEQPTAGHQGVQQGITSDPDTQAPKDVSNIGPGLLIGPGQDAIILTVSERYFNEAELAFRGISTGDPQTLYEAGITASFSTLGATGATTYYSQAIDNVSYTSSTDKLEAIITQKWIAVNGVTAEQSWFDWSRTGFPSGLPVSVEVPNLVRPVRLSYPASELGNNSSNVPSQPNVYSTPVFWGQ